MTTDIAKHIRIFNPNPDDDFVSKRIIAIETIKDILQEKSSVIELLELVNLLAAGFKNPEQFDMIAFKMVETAIKEQSASFSAEGQHLQLLTCTLVAVLKWLEEAKQDITSKSSTSGAAIFGMAIWSAFSFQPDSGMARLENLRVELIQSSKAIIEMLAQSIRQRKPVNTAQNFEENEETDSKEISEHLQDFISRYIEPLKINAELDREEIDILWWALNDWSTIANKKISRLNEVQACILNAIEISTLLKTYPSVAHYHLAFRCRRDDGMHSGEEILSELGDILTPIQTFLKKTEIIYKFPLIFPLFSILTNKSTATVSHVQKSSISEWTGRGLIEGTLINIGKLGTYGN